MLDIPRRGLDGSPESEKGASQRKTGGKNKDKKKKKTKKHDKFSSDVQRLAGVGTDLARLDVTLHQLQMRVEDLHSVQLGQEESRAVFQAGLDAVARRVDHQLQQGALTDQRATATQARLDALAETVETLRSELDGTTTALAHLATHRDRDTALFSFEDRLTDTENLLADVRGVLADFQARPDQSTRLRVLGERLDAVESNLQSDARAREAQTRPEEDHSQKAFRLFGNALERRIDTLARDLQSASKQAVDLRYNERARVDERLRSRGRAIGAGFAFLVVLFGTALAADWWRTGQRLDVTRARIAELEQQSVSPVTREATADGREPGQLESVLGELTATLERMDARNAALTDRVMQVPTPSEAEDVQSRLRHLEQMQADLHRESGVSAEMMAGLGAKLDLIAAARGEDRVDVIGKGERKAVAAAQSASPTAAASDGFDDSVMSVEQTGGRSLLGEASLARAPIVLEQGRYVIQLIAFRRESSVGQFARRFGIAQEARYMRSKYQGQDWYAVLLGEFDDRRSGMAAAAQLPAELRELKPWVRPVKAGARLIPVD